MSDEQCAHQPATFGGGLESERADVDARLGGPGSSISMIQTVDDCLRTTVEEEVPHSEWECPEVRQPTDKAFVIRQCARREDSLPLRYTLAQGSGRDALIEGHVLAAQLDVQRTSDLIRAEMPVRSARRSVSACADQEIGDGVSAATFLV